MKNLINKYTTISLYAKRIFSLSIFSALPLAAATYFPFEMGLFWEFSFHRTSGGMIGSSTASGTVKWEITNVEVLESFPEQYRIHFAETRSLIKETRDEYILLQDSSGFINADTTYDPPLETSREFTLHGTADGNGFSLDNDTCWSFILQKDSPQNAGMVALKDSGFTLGNIQMVYPAVVVDPAPCRAYPFADSVTTAIPIDILPIYDPTVFMQAEGLGPVGMHTESSPLLMDAYFSEDWILTSTNAGDNTPIGPVKETASGAFGYNPVNGELSLDVPESGWVEATFIDLAGRTRSLLSPTFFSAGRHSLSIFNSRNERHPGGPGSLRVEMSGRIYTGWVFLR